MVGLCRVLSGCVLWLIAIVLLDYRFDLPWFLRVLLLLSMGVAVALHAHRRLLRPLSLAYSDGQLARLVERPGACLRWPFVCVARRLGTSAIRSGGD